MNLALDPQTEQLLQRELDRGIYRDPNEVVKRALSLLAAEEDWLLRNKEAIGQKLETSMAQAQRGETYSP